MHRSIKYRTETFVVLIMAAVLSFACKKENQYSDIPEIISAELIPAADSADIVIVFTDGDGDFGLDKHETAPPYHAYDYDVNVEGDSVPNKYFYNIFLDYEVKDNGIWKVVNLSGETNARTPVITPKGQNKQIKATVTYHMLAQDFAVLIEDEVEQGDTIRYTLQVVDRALHESNRMATNEYIIP